MKKIILFLFLTGMLLSCSKEEKSFSYWSELASNKYEEIIKLSQSVACQNIDEFEIKPFAYSYILLHPSIQKEFNKLIKEYERFQLKASQAAGPGQVYNTLMPEPNPPLAKRCIDGKPSLIYPKDLSLDEAKAELESRSLILQDFYKDVPCTKAEDWFIARIRTGCCQEGIAVHKTIKTGEFLNHLHIYNRLMERKMTLEKVNCMGTQDCPQSSLPVQCINGKPVIPKA